MSLVSLEYLILIAAGSLVFYHTKGRAQKLCMFVMSMLFVLSFSIGAVVSVILASFISWKAAIRISEAEDKKVRMNRTKLGVILLLAQLVLLKYLPGMSRNPSSVFLKFACPIGISYYTLMLIGYVLDVDWKRIPAEPSFFTLLLTACWFPQMVQGPIGKVQEIIGQMNQDHTFELHSYKYGLQRLLWGIFQKTVIADRIGTAIGSFFLPDRAGLDLVWGLILYSIQLYADFSGGIDIILGTSECFGIRLSENFRQPYFSSTLGEFWRRWHISLGRWMKDYIFFPFSASSFSQKLTRKLRKSGVSRKQAARVSIALGNLLVFVLVGFWHGSGSKYVGWGIYNGIILSASALLEGWFIEVREKLHLHGRLWSLFRILRTYVIVLIGYLFDCTADAGQAWNAFLRLFSHGFHGVGFSVSELLILFIAVLAVLIVDLLHEHGISVRDRISCWSYGKQAVFWTILIQVIAIAGRVSSSGGFLYESF